MAERTPNARLKALIDESQMTYDGLAALVRTVAAEHGEALRTNKSNLAHWVRGTPPAEKTGRFLAIALSRRLGRILTVADIGLGSDASPGPDGDSMGLSLSVDPIDALMPLWRHELDRRDFLRTSAYSVAAAALPLETVIDLTARTGQAARSGSTIGMAEVQAVRDMVGAFSEMDERHGGQHGRTALITYLRDDVAPLCRGRFLTDEVRRQMLSAASRGVHLAGWKAYDAGSQSLAQRYYLQSYSLAVESGVRGHDGFVMRTMAMQGLKLHKPEHCQGLAETGLNRAKGHVDSQTEALFRIVHAHTLAKSGRPRAAVTETKQAHALLTEGTGRGDEVPFWALAWGPPVGSVHSRAAKVLEALGDHDAAAVEYGRAAASRPDAFARIVALDLVAEAEMYLKRGRIEQACDAWSRSMDHMAGVRSVRTRRAVKSMRSNLRAFRARGVRAAVELDERSRDFLTQA
ncbi:hypothetical protein [Streptomyces longispororuber]|uniref:hypothetical protein n=1 Tax=Streptomyces longispororuber TaxID=68230 RepID=UPI00210C4693|nr:hypothetical protein [Streptomyces longispororuber]MCQ4213390.1 hypothetical protein [Streptomyces longispororuber]